MPDDSLPNPPLAQPTGRWRRRATLALGYAATAVFPGRVKAIEEGRAGDDLSPADRLIVAALVHRAQRRQQPLDHLAYLHQRLWQDDAITAYHAAAEDRFTRWFLPHQAVVVDALIADLDAHPGAFTTVCEIGTGSGLVLDHLRQRLSPLGVRDCIGLDLSPQQVALNNRRFPACRFVAGDATTWIPAHLDAGWIVVCCGGVLEYFPRPALERLFAATATRPVRWVIVEPVDAGHDTARDTSSRVFGFENTWSHPYPHLLRSAGLDVLHDSHCTIDGVRWQLAVAGRN
jgi:hypothetical protein